MSYNGGLPAEVKRQRGRHPGVDSGGRKLPEPTLLYPVLDEAPEPPEQLQDSGLQVWKIAYAAAPWIGPTDTATVLAACRLADVVEASRRAYMTSLSATDGNTYAGLFQRLQIALAALGLDPVSRGKLGVAEVVKQSKLEQLLSKRAANG